MIVYVICLGMGRETVRTLLFDLHGVQQGSNKKCVALLLILISCIVLISPLIDPSSTSTYSLCRTNNTGVGGWGGGVDFDISLGGGGILLGRAV